MAKAFEKRNQTPGARRKLQGLAKANGVDVALVSATANFVWNFDEELGWVGGTKRTPAVETQLGVIAETLGLSPDFTLTREQAIDDLLKAHRKRSNETLWAEFVAGAPTKNFARVSEFASYHYLRGVTRPRAETLDWDKKGVDLVEVAKNLFLKFFRGGAVERDDLGYLWCDLTLPLAYAESPRPANWIEPFLKSVDALPAKSGLSDLIQCCQGHVGGDKYFKQEVLQALCYADVLRVNELPVAKMFIPDRRDESSPHAYSNEWSFPLRFWSTNGGTTNRGAVPALPRA